jgi:hypothetical protein
MNKEASKKEIKLFPLPVIIILSLSVIGVIVFCLFSVSTAFSDFVMKYIGTPIRILLAYVTNLIPFSLAESLLIASPIIVVTASVIAIRKYSSSWRLTGAFMIRALSALCCVWIIFVFGFAGGYKGTSLDKKLGFERKKVSPEELEYTASVLLDEVNAICDEIDFIPNGASVMPYSFEEMTKKLNEAYITLEERYDAISTFYSRPKQVILSEPWTYTHIAGVYTFFTGESNINVNFPDYTLPFTTAHEMAHQRGISREDEANFVAFLACAASDDPYIRYSGYQNLYEYVRSALYSADKDAYSSVRAREDLRIQYESYSYSLFFGKYRENVAANVSGTINNSYLQSQGTVGTKSYGMVVDLACAYFKQK